MYVYCVIMYMSCAIYHTVKIGKIKILLSVGNKEMDSHFATNSIVITRPKTNVSLQQKMKVNKQLPSFPSALFPCPQFGRAHNTQDNLQSQTRHNHLLHNMDAKPLFLQTFRSALQQKHDYKANRHELTATQLPFPFNIKVC